MSARISLALETGGLVLPDGPILVMHPSGEADLSALPTERVTIIQPHYPDYAIWSGRGYGCAPDVSGRYATALVFLPRAKAQARAVLAAAADTTDGLIIVDGAKTDGVDSILKDLRKRVDVSAPISKAHGKVFWFAVPESGFPDWRAEHSAFDGFVTAPGVFSADGIDPASRLLADVLPDKIGHHVVDLGAGWGYLSSAILQRPDIETLHLVEADHAALACARVNISDPRARFHWADALHWTPPKPVDAVIMNPPFHKARAADTGLGQAFIAAAARMLAPSGTLWMVANRHLPYETALRSAFREGDELAGDGRFKLFRAARPSRPAR